MTDRAEAEAMGERGRAVFEAQSGATGSDSAGADGVAGGAG